MFSCFITNLHPRECLVSFIVIYDVQASYIIELEQLDHGKGCHTAKLETFHTCIDHMIVCLTAKFWQHLQIMQTSQTLGCNFEFVSLKKILSAHTTFSRNPLNKIQTTSINPEKSHLRQQGVHL